ncbi:MAG: response regulator [Candidatus Manganitrophus sp.]|nr:MAG: response regulator [Candidatus Manganitrophus sp.]
MRNILIVDDKTTLLETLKDLLEERGYSVVTATTGEEAVKKAGEIGFDIALIDIILPGINGVETLREIKKLHPRIRAILMTAFAFGEFVEKTRDQEAVTILYKPFSPEKMFGVIEPS